MVLLQQPTVRRPGTGLGKDELLKGNHHDWRVLTNSTRVCLSFLVTDPARVETGLLSRLPELRAGGPS
jgi:hypothetical protein